MTKPRKASVRTTIKDLILGRTVAEKLNAVEGITPSQELRRIFSEFDRLGLTAEQRRCRLMKQLGKQNS